MAGKITTNSVVLGDSITDTQNFVLKTNADGTATLARGALGGLGTVFGVNGSSAITGATLVAPALGTPASGVLTNCTGVPASALPAGCVLQVVQGTSLATQISTTSASLADTGLTVTITPRSTSSTVLILVNGSGLAGTVSSTYAQFNLLRGASSIINFNQIAGYNTSSTANAHSFNTAYLDSPSSVSATTYKVQWARSAGTGTMYLNNGTSVCTIIAMEIQG